MIALLFLCYGNCGILMVSNYDTLWATNIAMENHHL